MEGQQHKLDMCLNLGGNGNYVSYPNQNLVLGAASFNGLSSPHWNHLHESPPSFVELLNENSSFLEKASGADMLQTLTSTIAGHTQSVEGLSECQSDLLLLKNPDKACGFQAGDSSFGMTAWQNSYNEVKPRHIFANFPQQNLAPLWKEQSEASSNLPQLPPRVTVAPSLLLPRQRHRASKQRAAVSDRHRRMRIAEKLRSLQELIPHPIEGSQAAILDNAIDHIKFLQLQMKELSQSILGGQPTSKPFIFLEGYGHYVISEHMTNESLEEMLGKLLETNPTEAIKLLESKGLYMMPMSLLGKSGQPA